MVPLVLPAHALLPGFGVCHGRSEESPGITSGHAGGQMGPTGDSTFAKFSRPAQVLDKVHRAARPARPELAFEAFVK